MVVDEEGGDARGGEEDEEEEFCARLEGVSAVGPREWWRKRVRLTSRWREVTSPAMLAFKNISFSIEGKKLFEDASALIPAGHKVGIRRA